MSETPERPKGLGGTTTRTPHEPVRKRAPRDRAAQKMRNVLTQPQNRWQRLVRYVWDRGGKR